MTDMERLLDEARELWVCECGQACNPMSPDWRCAGSYWEHYHGQPIGHVAAKKNALAHLGKALFDKVKNRVAGCGWSEGDEEMLELAQSLGAGNVRQVIYDPDKHGEMEASRGDKVWFWGEDK